MTEPTLDILALGNAIVDVLARVDDALIEAEGMTKGSMRLIDAADASRLYAAMPAGREISGGSAANTLAGAAALGARCAFVGRVAPDQLGEVFAHDIRAQGVAYTTPVGPIDPPTARCLILVTECGERTMNTYLGAAQFLPPEDLDEAQVASAAILLLEGYLWDPAEPRAAMRRAVRVAKAAGRKVALGVSAVFCILNHRGDFLALIEAGDVDILFANEEEVLALAGTATFDEGVEFLRQRVPLLVATRGADGAIAVRGDERATCAAEPVERVVDTTGAGDLFSAGFLAGLVQERSLEDCLTMGAVAAAEVIGHFGARPEADLKALVAKRLG
ncbi:adenosine kinase [Sphingomonas jatrophae]|uniref:Sugar or nucleoside kinase, ribokinase family n=1 Tax=Sphingomonas jatrophae TaxID=1166337 RepID=A0A1I6JQU0_9SPHN|nr:adenosine kinase [Sphingomonas jatrophae]SFR81327.1 Sugar or nucleoside kinase, ribokinase family [Sphingomonas jatrophae]